MNVDASNPAFRKPFASASNPARGKFTTDSRTTGSFSTVNDTGSSVCVRSQSCHSEVI